MSNKSNDNLLHTHTTLFTINTKAYCFLIFLLSDDPCCPVKSLMKYKGHLNPKCNRLFHVIGDLARQRTHVIGDLARQRTHVIGDLARQRTHVIGGPSKAENARHW